MTKEDSGPSPTAEPNAGPSPAQPSGVTLASTLTATVLLLLLAWALPQWNLTKAMAIGIGGYLPLEAMILALALLAFNRFQGIFYLVCGLVLTALLVPSWHEAVNAKPPAANVSAAEGLSGLARMLFRAFSGTIEAAQTQSAKGRPALLVGAGVLLTLLGGVGLGRVAALAAPALRRRFHWREILVVFVLLSVGTFTYRSLEFTVGGLTAPFKDDQNGNLRERALHPIPPSQDPDNRSGPPDGLFPYNPNRFTEGSPEQRAESDRLKEFRQGYRQRAPRYDDTTKTAADRAKERQEAWNAFLDRWQGPLCWWLPLLALILLVQVFLAAMLRRQWADHEKLMFPHAQAVRALAEGEDLSTRGRRILSSPVLWIGFALAAGLGLLQGLNHYFQAVPAPGLHDLNLRELITERPWSAIEKRHTIMPFMVGISYLLTAELSLSMWVFGLVNQGLRVLASMWGLNAQEEAWAVHGEWQNSDALYTGAIFVFVGWLLLGGRRHIWFVIRRGLGLCPPDAGEKSEPMSYPVAFWGFWLCVAGILGWCVLVGVKLWIMAVLFGLFLVMVILICRVVAEAGVLTAGIQMWPYFPQQVFCHLFGYGQGVAYAENWFSSSAKVGLVPVTVRTLGVWQFIWSGMLYNLQLTPFFLTGFKLTETEPRRKRLLTWLMIAALFVGAAIFLHGLLDYFFEFGTDGTAYSRPTGANRSSWSFGNKYLRDIVNKERMWNPDEFRIGCMLGGGGLMTGLLLMRHFFYWWPLHPIGMVAPGLEGGLWLSFFLGWLFKRVALAYGGGEFSQRINPFFYGLIAGQFANAALWCLVGICGQGCQSPGPILPGVGN